MHYLTFSHSERSNMMKIGKLIRDLCYLVVHFAPEALDLRTKSNLGR